VKKGHTPNPVMRLGYSFIFLALIAATLVSLPKSASAATIVVDGTSIQSAIDSANPADIIDIRAGTYVQNLNINKKLIIRCANAGVPAGAILGTRDAETIIQGEATVTAPDVVIDGCRFVRPDVAVDLAAPKLISSDVDGQTTVRNSVFDLTLSGTANTRACGGGTYGRAAWRIYDNEFLNARFAGCPTVGNGSADTRAVHASQPDASLAQKVIIKGNRFSNTERAVFLDKSNTGGIQSEVLDNLFTGPADGQGIILHYQTKNILIKGNSFINLFIAVNMWDADEMVINNNLFSPSTSRAVFGSSERTVMQNNAILSSFGITNNRLNDGTAKAFNASSNWWDNRDASGLVGGTILEGDSPAAFDVTDPILSPEIIPSTVGFYYVVANGDQPPDQIASHVVTYAVESARRISVEALTGTDTTVDFGTVSRSSETSVTGVRLKFTAQDVTASSAVKVIASINKETGTGITLTVAAGAVTGITTGALTAQSLAITNKNIIPGILNDSGVNDATSNLTYTLTTTSAAALGAEILTVTYTLTDDDPPAS
jgi:hypothetical protein